MCRHGNTETGELRREGESEVVVEVVVLGVEYNKKEIDTNL